MPPRRRHALLAAALLSATAADAAPSVGGWAAGNVSFANGAAWNATVGAAFVPQGWPPAYVALPPLYVGDGPFTVALWVRADAPGALLSLGNGPAGAPSLSGDFLTLWAGAAGVGATWSSGGARASTPACGAGSLVGAGWTYVALSVSGQVYALRVGANAGCAGTLPVPAPAAWWFSSMLGGAGFSGWIASAAVYDRAAFNNSELAVLGAQGSCPAAWPAGSGVAPAPLPTLAAADAWASSSGPTGCFSASGPAPCDARALLGSPGGSTTFLTAAGIDKLPAVTVDLGASALVGGVRVWNGADGYDVDPPASYALLVGDARPPPAGVALSAPLAANPVCNRTARAPVPLGRVFEIQCVARGRFVTLQLLAGGVSPGVLKLSRFEVLAADPQPPASPAPASPRGPAAPAGAGQAQWDATHRYGGWGLAGSALLDAGLRPLSGLVQSVTLDSNGSLAFSAAASCVTVPDLALDAQNFTAVARVVAPGALPAFSSWVVWSAGAARLELRTGSAAGTAWPTLSVQGREHVAATALAAGEAASVAARCQGTQCSLLL